MSQLLFKLDQFTSQISKGILIITVPSLVILVFTSVLGRFVFSATPHFIEETSRYFLIWTGALGASVAVRTGDFIHVEAFQKLFSPKVNSILERTSSLIVILFLLFLFIGGLGVSWQQKSQMAATLPISMMWPTLAIPVSAVLMLPHYLLVLLSKKEVKS
ncbi:MAG: hypothetical protein VR72_13110 [Clostridiaceae bacterium BRH_c20a]|nr:MAG: hypothetical protein VR72_13110 [Clostridiaceae bacterium BRH_c20a]